MTWTDSDRDGERYLRLVKAETTPRSTMETRAGQRAARERLEHLWERAKSKQAIQRTLTTMTFSIQLAPERATQQMRPLKWHPKTGT